MIICNYNEFSHSLSLSFWLLLQRWVVVFTHVKLICRAARASPGSSTKTNRDIDSHNLLFRCSLPEIFSCEPLRRREKCWAHLRTSIKIVLISRREEKKLSVNIHIWFRFRLDGFSSRLRNTIPRVAFLFSFYRAIYFSAARRLFAYSS